MAADTQTVILEAREQRAEWLREDLRAGETAPLAGPGPSLGVNLGLYRQMFTIRTVEERLLALYQEGRLRGTIHTCLGQEACAVGVVGALDKAKDVLFSNHRAHGHYLAYSDDVEGLIAEIMGRSTGVCGGIGGSQHLHRGNFYTNGIQGGIVPVSVGAALAEKTKGSGAIVAVFLGDGTMGQGAVYESFNVAALWKLPSLFVLEDNKYAQSTPCWRAHAGALHDRAKPFGIATLTADGNDLFDARRKAGEAAARVREGRGPALLVLDTFRLGPHSKGDDTRDRNELEAHRRNEPVRKLRDILGAGNVSPIEKQVAERVERAVALATAARHTSFEQFARG
jgi:TPP-dependent pyruvate/acetoin dehydrogenase alpha subunit